MSKETRQIRKHLDELSKQVVSFEVTAIGIILDKIDAQPTISDVVESMEAELKTLPDDSSMAVEIIDMYLNNTPIKQAIELINKHTELCKKK